MAERPASEEVFVVAEGTEPRETPQAMGFKAYNLLRMARIGLPVPAAFVLGTSFCRDYYRRGGTARGGIPRSACAEYPPHRELVRDGFWQLAPAAARVGALGRGRVDARHDGHGAQCRPVRRCAARNAAHDRQSAAGVGFLPPTDPVFRRSGCRRASQSRTRSHWPHACARRESSGCRTSISRPSSSSPRHTSTSTSTRPATRFRRIPLDQLEAAVEAVFRSWQSPRAVAYRRLAGIDDALGTAVTVQRMVFGNSGGTSGAGVAFTRNPATGENELYMDFATNAQGEDVVSGRHSLHEPGRSRGHTAAGLRRNHVGARQAGARIRRCAGIRIHGAGRAAVHVADAQRQAHSARGAADRGGAGPGGADRDRRRRLRGWRESTWRPSGTCASRRIRRPPCAGRCRRASASRPAK